MKIQPLAQLAATAPDEQAAFEQRIESLKWRLWNGQAQRALSLITKLRRELVNVEQIDLWERRAEKHLETLQTYVRRNKSSVIDYAARYRAGKRIATSPAEASVNRLVAKRFVKKQQMRWTPAGAHYLLKVRAAVLNGDLSERTKYERPTIPLEGNLASFVNPTSPLLRAA